MSMVSLALAPVWVRSPPIRETRDPWSVWRRQEIQSSVVAFAKRSGRGNTKSKTKQRKAREVLGDGSDEDDEDDDDPILDDDDALEALFSQLEKDWEDEKAGKKVDVETPSEGELEAFMKEVNAEGGKSRKKSPKKKQESVEVEESENSNEEVSTNVEEEDDEEQDTRSGLAKFIETAERLESERVVKRIVKLERWQLRKLKAALDVEKKQLKVKALAAETGLDRRDVLTFLRDPPPQLIELIDSISDDEEEEEEEEEEVKTPIDAEVKTAEEQNQPLKPAETFASGDDTQGEGPKAWYGRKRIPREYLETFEKVYRRTKRPTGALIQNIVELTHVPRKRVLDWFEARRREDDIRREERKLQSGSKK